MENADFTGGSYISIPATVCKAIPGQEDKDGNYTFEVEASNENLDLQNQKILQSALLKSKEYFLTNGVVSDDHQHKVRKEDGSVETNKDKIIGEPVSVRTDGKKTFVKGILYGAVEAAKPFINLLKAHSSRVKASVGGIMPKVLENPDGSETVTSFIWNDLALTCSPVNWTVGSACFAKSMSAVDFCKALSAGSGTDAGEYTDGRSLQGEDLEKKTAKIIDITGGELTGEDSSDDLEKSDKAIIREAEVCVGTGELKTKKDVEKFLMERGFSIDKARAQALVIIDNGGTEMKKSHFSDTIDELLKSLGGGEEAVKKDDKEDGGKGTLFDNSDKEPDEEDSDGEEDEDVKKGCVKKSQNENGEDYLDITDVMKSLGAGLDELRAENEELKKSLAETQEKMAEVTKSFSEYLKTPNSRNTVVEKSMNSSDGNSVQKKPTAKDFDILKSALVKSSSTGKITIDQVQFYSSEFQKSMAGKKISQNVWNEICNIVKENR